MTDNADAFSEFESPPTVDDPIIAQGGQNPADPFAEFDAPKEAVLREGPAPSLYESFKTNFKGMAGGLFEQGARTSDVLKAKSTISRADQGGVAGPGDVFSSKPTQLEVDKAIGDLAIWQADRDRYESFSSPTLGGKAAGFAGGLIGGALDPTMLIPISRVGEAYKGASTVAEVATYVSKTGLEFGAFSAAADTVSQELDIAAGYQDTFDKQRLLYATALGAGLGGGIGGMSMLVRGLRGELASQIDRSVGETLGEPFSRPPMVEPGKISEAPAGINAQIEFAPPNQPVSNIPLDNKLTASEMLSDVSGALNNGSIDAMRFSAPPRTEEIDALIEAGKLAEGKEIDRLFGEDAEKVKGLIRRGRTDTVDDIIFDKFGSYETPEAKQAMRVIYGMNNYSIVNTENLQNLRDRLSGLEFAVSDAANGDSSELVKELSWVAPKLPDINAPESSHTSDQRIAVLSLARAIEDMRANNINPEPILRQTVDYTSQRVNGDASDTMILLDRLSQYANRYMDTGNNIQPAAPKAPPPPAVEAAIEATQLIKDIPAQELRATIPVYDEVAQVISQPQAEGAPAGIFMFNPTELKVDAKRFQFKEGGDEQGVTTTLKSVTKWDQAKGNQVIVWQDNSGQLFVVDGHQRSGLARRLIETGKEQDIQLPGLLYREADGVSAEDARSIAAVKNIAEGSGSAIDGAKVLRTRPDLMDGSLPLSAGKSRQAANLSKLGDEPFRMVLNDVVPENYGAIVGERIPNDPARQEAAIKALARFEPRNENEAAVLVQRVAQAELEKAQEGAQASMFGDLESAESTAGEEMRIVGKAIQELKKDKTLFSRVVANAERIEQTGSKIEQEAAKTVTDESELFAKRLASDAYTAGPLREEIKAAAKDLRDGKITVGEATARIRSSLRGAAETDGGPGLGNRANNEPAIGRDQQAQISQAAKSAEDRSFTVTGEYELRHGLKKDAAKKFDKTGTHEFVDNYKGERYDGEGDSSVFGNAIYLDNTGIWTNDEGRGMGLWDIKKSIRVSYKPKNALLLTPETISTIRGKIGINKEKILTPEMVKDYAKANNHDSIIIQGFDNLIKKAQEDYAQKYNVPNELNNWETDADRIPFDNLEKQDQQLLLKRAKDNAKGDKEEYNRYVNNMKNNGANLFMLSDAEVHTKGRFADTISQDQVVVYDKSIVKTLGEAPKGEVFPGLRFEPDAARASERTAAGEQNLIPGVNPVTDADRILVEQQRSLTGGNEPAGGMFDEGNTRQSELFLKGKRSGPQGPDADFRRRSNREQLPNSSETIVGPREGVSDAEARSFRRDTIMAQIAIDLGRQFKVDTRVTPGALGTYKPQQGVLRVRYSGDVEVFTHELGHAIDQLLANDPGAKAAWNGLRSAQPSELALLAPGQPIEEGVAEFTRLFITNPMAAAREAPMTTQAFQAILNVRPQIAKAISDAQALSKVESGLQPHQAFEAMIAPQSNGAIAKFSAEVKKQGFVPTVADYASVIYQQLIGRDQAFSRFANQLREARFNKTGKPLGLSFSSDPYTLFRRLPGAEQAAIGAIRDGIRPYGDITAKPVSPSLSGAIEKALGASISRLSNDNDPLVRGFNAYLIARRAKSLWERWETGDLRNQPVNASKNETLRTIEYYEQANPNFKAGADDMFAFMRANFERQVDAGIIPKSVADKILARGDDYIPFFRDFEAEKGTKRSGARGGAGIEYAPIMELRGSTRDILNPIKSAIQSVSISERLIARNEVWKALDKWAEEAKEFSGQWWEIIPNNEIKASTVDIAEAIKANVRSNGGSSADAELAIRQLEGMVGEDLSATLYKHEATTARGERVAFFWKNGERTAVKVGNNKIASDFFDLMTSMSEPERDLFIKAVSAGNGMFQSMIVHAPRFTLGTLVRDNVTRIFTPRYMGLGGRVFGSQDITGLLTLLFDQEFYKTWASAGATRGGIYTHAARELAGENPYLAVNGGKTFVGRTIDELRSADGPLMVGKAIFTTPAKFLSDATKLIESAETISRLGVAKKTYDYLKKHGLSDHEAMFGALHESKDVLPYERHGSGVTSLARLVPFLNAGIQGADRAARGLAAEPVAAAITAYRRGGYKNLDANQKIALNNAAINWMYIGAAAGLTGTVYYNYAKDTDFYKNASEYLRENYWLIETGKDKDGNPVGLTVHKPYDLPSVFINGIERFMHATENHLPNVAGETFGAIQEAFPRQFHSTGDALGAFTIPKTAFELALNKKLGFAGKEPKDIIPERLKGLPPEMQQDAMSSWISKKIGSTFGVSPKIVDHVIDSLGGTGGQDLKDISSAIFDDNPIKSPQDALNRAFFGQVYRTQRGAPGVKADLQDLIAKDHGSFALAANEYRTLLEEGQKDRAERLYNRSDNATKAYMTLQTSAKFDAEMRQLHPLERSSKISSIAYNMMRDLNLKQIAVEDRSQNRGEERKVIRVNDDQARKLMAQFNQLSIEETRNGLHIAGQPGYEAFGILDSIASRLSIISDISPEAGKELSKRLKAAHILPAQGVAAVWPEAEKRLLQDQGRARLHELVGRARRTVMSREPETVQ